MFCLAWILIDHIRGGREIDAAMLATLRATVCATELPKSPARTCHFVCQRVSFALCASRGRRMAAGGTGIPRGDACVPSSNWWSNLTYAGFVSPLCFTSRGGTYRLSCRGVEAKKRRASKPTRFTEPNAPAIVREPRASLTCTSQSRTAPCVRACEHSSAAVRL
eukprot:6184410-Pleurochrysis_carterae.AAC.7